MTLQADLNALPIIDSQFISIHNISNVRTTIAVLCGQTQDRIMKVIANLTQYSDEQLLEHLTPRVSHSLAEIGNDAQSRMDTLGMLGGSGSWCKIQSFYVLYTKSHWFSHRDAIAFIMRTGYSTWQLSDLSRYVIVE
jgi:hypothetical protein